MSKTKTNNILKNGTFYKIIVASNNNLLMKLSYILFDYLNYLMTETYCSAIIIRLADDISK